MLSLVELLGQLLTLSTELLKLDDYSKLELDYKFGLLGTWVSFSSFNFPKITKIS